MPNPIVFTNARLWLGGYDLSGASNYVTMPMRRAELADSRFTDGMQAVYPGAINTEVGARGFFDSDLDGPLFDKLNSIGVLWPFSVMPDDAVLGDLAYMLEGREVSYTSQSGRWGESLPYNLSVKPGSTGRLARGQVLYPKTTIAATTAGTKLQIGALAAGQSLLVCLHVFSATGTVNWAVDVESDVDAIAAGETVRGSFADIVTTGAQTQIIEIAGPVTDTFWRVVFTKTTGTALTAAVTAAIVTT